MKAKIGLAILAVLLVALFASCDFNASVMTGTTWTYEAAGTGVGLKFITATTGTTTVGILGAWSNNTAFTYTYDGATKKGTITLDGYTTGTSFTVSGNELSYAYLTYKYKP